MKREDDVVETEEKSPSVKRIASMFSVSKTDNSEPAIKMQKSTRKFIAPRFITPLVGVIVEQNARVILEAIMDGS